ncbi:hypothetical protein [Sandarakinorhabdus glacialis]|uniref:hypothetical protein n=1 Tax=Sandarakinorhabdus glacialis TaxID=1614636 RepID=UPI0016653EB1|nr:hypothetical protein [Polymorphobacter glacialis]
MIKLLTPKPRHRVAGWSFSWLAAAIGVAPAIATEGGQSPYFNGYRAFLTGIVPPYQGLYIRNGGQHRDALRCHEACRRFRVGQGSV